jgi:hypothetical protein
LISTSILRPVVRATISLILAAFCLTPAVCFAQQPTHRQTVKPVWSNIDLKGEVVDSWCYASRSVGEGRGADHEACAKACAHGGVTLGIVDDSGKMYIAAKSKGYQGCQLLLEPFVAKRVHIKGMVAGIGGCPVLKIVSVEELGAGDKPLHAKVDANANSPAAKYHGGSKQAGKSKWVTPDKHCAD